MRAITISVHLAIPILMLLVTACGGSYSTEKVVETYPVTAVIRKDTVLIKEYVSDIHAFRNVEIRARVPGYLDQIFVDEGHEVKKGELLFQINDEEYRVALAQARANLNGAMAEATALLLEMERVRILVEKTVVSETELRLAKVKYEAANARIEEARSVESHAAIRLSYTKIRSPFDGTLDRIPFKIGSLIDEGTLLTSLSDTQAMYAYFKVSEKEYLHFMRNINDNPEDDEVELRLADGSLHRFRGKIETMEGEFEATTGTIAFRAIFPNVDHLLKHGSSGKVRLAVNMRGALLVPQKSTFEIQDKTYVFLVDAQQTARMRSFVPRMRLAQFYVVESGLNMGELIIYEGIQDVREGDKILPKLAPMDSLLRR